MYPQADTSMGQDAQQNIPSMALMYTMYTPTFGNYSFVINAPQRGQLADQFPSVGYLSLEALLYMGQASNPQVSPTNVQTGVTSGIQNLQGAQVQNDATGTGRSLSGYQAGTQSFV